MIVADTGAIVALIDADDRHHDVLRSAFDGDPDAWVLPWAILPEVDHIVTSRVGDAAGRAFRGELRDGAFGVEWGDAADLARAVQLDAHYVDLSLGLVDALVMAVAERLGALAIATLDLRDFGAVTLTGAPAIWPRDL